MTINMREAQIDPEMFALFEANYYYMVVCFVMHDLMISYYADVYLYLYLNNAY